MATQCETTGVIVKASENSCVVSVMIDGSLKSFAFSKRIFYTFGVKCDGDMTNLLEEDMEVELCYKVCQGSSLTFLAVWLGDRPELLEEETVLKPIYDRKGVLSHAHLNDYIVDSDDGKVLVSKRVVFRDGQPVPTITADDEISFDAIPFQDIHVCGAVYEATCAWIGLKPGLVTRFDLQAEETKAEFGDVVSGTVGVIPNDVVAMVDVEVDTMLIKVLLFRSSFKVEHDSIQDVVNAGDRLFMRLSYNYLFPGRKQWFAVKASKASDEVSFDLLEACEPQNVATLNRDIEAKSAEATHCDIRSVETEETVNDVLKNVGSAKPSVQYDKNCKILYSDPPLTGVISRSFTFQPFVCIRYGNSRILLERCNFYANGERAKSDYFDSYITSGENTVNFEAALMNREETKYAVFSHEATCAWVGKKPNLQAIAASLPPPNFELLEEVDQIFYGIVSKLCFPSVALVNIPGLSTTVSIHVNGFINKHRIERGPGRHLIGNFVGLNDCVQFKVQKLPQCPKLLCSYDVQREYSKRIRNSVSAGLLSRKSHADVNGKKIHALKSIAQTVPSKTTKAHSSSSERAVCIASPFKASRLSQERAFLICCSGTIKTRCNENTNINFVTIEHVFGSSKLNDHFVYIRKGKAVGTQSMASLNGHQVRFDAETVMCPNSNSNFVVKRMWDTGDKRPPPEIVLYSELRLLERVSTRCCPGKITSIPLHDAAVAAVKNVPVLVPFDSLATLPQVNLGCSSIDTLLSVGDFVGLRFEKRNFPGERDGCYFRAISCWSLNKGGDKITSDDQIRTCVPRINSWFNKWGFGSFFSTGSVLHCDDRYFVRHASGRLDSALSLDIFGKGKVCVDGNPVTLDSFKDQKDNWITYHVAHEYVDKLSDDKSHKMFAPKGMFVACSWVGKEPSPKHLLKDVLAVPKGSICSNWCYEVVVEYFPLPTHAICRLGYAPVLVPLPQLIQVGTFVGVSDVNLKKGDRIIVRILEEIVGDSVILISNDSNLKRVIEYDYNDVIKNVSGTIVKLPRPTGFIKAYNGGITVSFELCHIRKSKRTPSSDKKWFESLNDKIWYDKKVYFSAVKVNAKAAPYRAFEVYFD